MYILQTSYIIWRVSSIYARSYPFFWGNVDPSSQEETIPLRASFSHSAGCYLQGRKDGRKMWRFSWGWPTCCGSVSGNLSYYNKHVFLSLTGHAFFMVYKGPGCWKHEVATGKQDATMVRYIFWVNIITRIFIYSTTCWETPQVSDDTVCLFTYGCFRK